MEAKEPYIEYELHTTQVEALRSKLIAAIGSITDIQLLKKFESLLSVSKSTDQKAKELNHSSEYIDSLIIKGGKKIPADVNSIDSLLDEDKYKL